jgi:hypothetical protein
MIQISLKVDETEDPRLAAWIKSFQGKKSKELSANIRRVLRTYISGHGTGQPDQEGAFNNGKA